MKSINAIMKFICVMIFGITLYALEGEDKELVESTLSNEFFLALMDDTQDATSGLDDEDEEGNDADTTPDLDDADPDLLDTDTTPGLDDEDEEGNDADTTPDLDDADPDILDTDTTLDTTAGPDEEDEESTEEQPEEAEVSEPVVTAPEVTLEQPISFEPTVQPKSAEPATEKPPASPKSTVETEPKEILPEPDKELPIIPPEPVEYGEGIDTIDIDSSGNWLQKRVIWEDAQEKYEAIKGILTRIDDTHIEFFTKRNDLERDVNSFFIGTGFTQGGLEEAINEAIATIEQERKEQGMIDEQERVLEATLVERGGDVEQLRLDVKAISELDVALGDALAELEKQNGIARDYEQQAWDRFKAIGQELDDLKAREHYFYMDALAQNIDAIYQYITGPFNQYFTESMQKMQEHISTIQSSLESLEKQGVSLQKQGDVVEEQPASDAKQSEASQQQGWLASSKAWLSNTGAAIRSWFSDSWAKIGSWFGSQEA